jgi:hypothetical protein
MWPFASIPVKWTALAGMVFVKPASDLQTAFIVAIWSGLVELTGIYAPIKYMCCFVFLRESAIARPG